MSQGFAELVSENQASQNLDPMPDDRTRGLAIMLAGKGSVFADSNNNGDLLRGTFVIPGKKKHQRNLSLKLMKILLLVSISFIWFPPFFFSFFL